MITTLAELCGGSEKVRAEFLKCFKGVEDEEHLKIARLSYNRGFDDCNNLLVSAMRCGQLEVRYTEEDGTVLSLTPEYPE